MKSKVTVLQSPEHLAEVYKEMKDVDLDLKWVEESKSQEANPLAS